MKYTVQLEEDENGDLVLPLNDDLLNELDWAIGDNIHWNDNNDGSFTMTKAEQVETELVLVECISVFRNRYVVEVPRGKQHWAADTVIMDESVEFSQKHIEENIISERVINDKEFIELFDKDNDYAKSWTIDQKRTLITKLNEKESVLDKKKKWKWAPIHPDKR